MIRFLTLVISSVLALNVSAQTFEGKILYTTTYKSKVKNIKDEQLTSMMGSSLEYFIKGDKYLSRTNGSYFQWQLYVPKENRIYNKFSTSETATWVDAAKTTNEIIKIAVRKRIATVLGYEVDEITITDRNSVGTYYFNSKLAADPSLFARHKYGNWYDFLTTAKALPLKFTLENAQFSLETVAIEINERKLDDKLFELPDQKPTKTRRVVMNRKDLFNEDFYDAERTQELAFRISTGKISRREYFRLLTAGVAGAAISNFSPAGVLAQDNKAILKNASPEFFIRNGSNLEMRWEAMYNRGYIVPTELFFVRNNSPAVPQIDPAKWRLQIEGSGVSLPRGFTYDDLLSMPSISVIRAIECAGNGRNLFEASHGKKIAGTPWNLGGIGVAEWTGVPLREVLDRAGLKRSARDVMPEGLDEKKVSRPMPVEKAMGEDTLLVYAMNGQPLLPDHGFPVRVLVPGWVGISHTKWVGRIEVSEQSLYSEYNTKKYVMIGKDYKPAPPALGPMLTTQQVKSAFELPWNGEIAAGKHLLRGRSWSGEGYIKKVDVSTDGGSTWRQARLREPNIDMAWVRWDIDWDARQGTYKLQARATDSKGRMQPDRIPFNEEGYAHWAVASHNIKVR